MRGVISTTRERNELGEARAEIERLRGYLREKNEIIKAYAGPTGMTPEDVAYAVAERERLRVVVEAAERWRVTSMYGDIGDISASRRADQAECELAAALERLSTGKETEDG